MVDKTTSAENLSGPVADVDLFRGVQGGANVRVTFALVKAWIKAWISRADLGLDNQLFSVIPQNSQSAAYTTILTDAQKHIFHPAADVTARIYTIDSNANVPYPLGTVITFVNQHGAGVITIAIATDTMRLAGVGTLGSRTLAADGIATAMKITATEWIISGTGLT